MKLYDLVDHIIISGQYYIIDDKLHIENSRKSYIFDIDFTSEDRFFTLHKNETYERVLEVDEYCMDTKFRCVQYCICSCKTHTCQMI